MRTKLLFPLWIHCLFGLALSLYTIQPWSIRFGQVPIQIVIIWFLLASLFILRLEWIKLIPRAYGGGIITMIIIIVVSILLRTVIDGNDFLRLFQVLTGVSISIISALLINDLRGSKFFIYPFLFTAVASGFVAVMQSIGKLKFTWAYTVYHYSPDKIPSGMESFPVAFSYSVIGIFVLILTLSFHDFRNKKGKVNIVKPIIGLACCLVIFAGVQVSESRSGFLAICIGVMLCSFLMKKTRKKFINPLSIVGVLALAIVFAFATNLSLISKLTNKIDEAMIDGRITDTWTIFIPLIIDKPFGVSSSEREGRDGSVNMGSNLSASETLKENNGYDPHNFIMTTMLYFGIPAGLSLLGIYLAVIYKGAKTASLIMYGSVLDNTKAVLLLCLVSSNVALIIHAWFHNANLVVGEMRGWFWIGAVLGLAYFSKINRSVKC
tara:strand:- start:2741 stop:4048 length:1308 start_codon:yes stop_codon:yes gene_type:complete